jgi:regulatory protein
VQRIGTLGARAAASVVSSDEERLEHALGLAYRLLNARDRTVSEMARQLERKGIDADTREQAIRTLGEIGYLDDERFARLFIADKRGLEHWGEDRIRARLRARGIDPDLMQAQLDQIQGSDEETELDRALSLLRQRFPAPPRERRERDRALGVLLRKGYDSELALDALTAYACDDRG